jgi:hypothetical protein
LMYAQLATVMHADAIANDMRRSAPSFRGLSLLASVAAALRRAAGFFGHKASHQR